MSDKSTPFVDDGVGGAAQSAMLRRVLGIALPAGFLLLSVWLAFDELRALDLHALRASIREVPAATLLLLQAGALLAVLAMGMYDLYLARVLGLNVAMGTVLRFAWVANTFNNLTGLAGLAGSGIRLLLFGRQGIAPRTLVIYSGIILLAIPTGLGLLAWPVLLLAHAQLPLPSLISLVALLAFALLPPLFLVFAGRRRLLAHWPDGARPLHFGRRAVLVLISGLDWLLAVIVAYACLRVAGVDVDPTSFVVAFVLAAALGIFSMIPGGLGVFDGLLLSALSRDGLATEPLLAGILLYRLVYYLVPWLIGIYTGAGLLVAPDHALRLSLARHWQQNTLLALVRLPLGMLSALVVRALSYLTFGAGVMLLVSAAFPTLADRLAILRDVVPLLAIETSHLLSVGVAILLIALSRGVADQVRDAYRLTQFLLLGGALFSIVKGIDFEEAISLLAVSGLLWLRRADFYRIAYPIVSLRSVYWFVALLIVLAGYLLLGSWLHGEALWHSSHWLQFAHALEAPRFQRSALFAVLVALAYLGWSFFRMPAPVLEYPDAETLDRTRELLETHGGNGFSHLVFMGDKYLFRPHNERALIQFGCIRDRLIALGDPCGDPQSCDTAILEFREFADAYDRVPVFYEVSEQNIHRYHDHGFSLFKLGEQAVVRIENFTLAGKRGEALRHGVNRAKREFASFAMLAHPLDESTWVELQQISDQWLSERDSAEKGFSLGSFDRGYLERAPIAAVYHQERIVAFASLMPGYRDLRELSVDLMRHGALAPPGTMDFLFVSLIEYARETGYREFNLGMAPLSGVGTTRFARADERIARLAYEYGNRLYNYKGLRGFKEKFHPEWRGTYLAYPAFTPLPGLLIDTAALVAGGYRRILFKP
ncbi:MAG: bifunctional lysylphosphatidylglycerol flippase/synthetase MprF [Gammaproteobacteria bacterium]|nr:bifunctional lysylphosphatidylglycerol flippase/synthetase MprF [Gammaproteobacteria bacterium]